MQNSDDILVVLVLYNTTLNETPAYKSLSAARRTSHAKGHLFVYDNSKEGQSISVTESWEVTYRHDPSNPGVSKAYNQAGAFAAAKGLPWLMLADQDTEFPLNIFTRYIEARIVESECAIFAPLLIDTFGIVSPFRQRFGRGLRQKQISFGKVHFDGLYAINSGLLISSKLFGAVGGYDERVRLDFSDVNFFHKIKSKATYFTVVNAVCQHTLSSSQETKLSDAVNRFTIYLEGSRITGRVFGRSIFFESYAMLRALKLSLRYRSFAFFESLFSRAA